MKMSIIALGMALKPVIQERQNSHFLTERHHAGYDVMSEIFEEAHPHILDAYKEFLKKDLSSYTGKFVMDSPFRVDDTVEFNSFIETMLEFTELCKAAGVDWSSKRFIADYKVGRKLYQIFKDNNHHELLVSYLEKLD